jgi:hypothetical protein
MISFCLRRRRIKRWTLHLNALYNRKVQHRLRKTLFLNWSLSNRVVQIAKSNKNLQKKIYIDSYNAR